MRRHLISVFDYFSFFSYAPSFKEIHTFFPIKISQKDLRMLLTEECKRKIVVRLPKNNDFRAYRYSILNFLPKGQSTFGRGPEFPHYTLPQYSIQVKNKLKLQIQIQNKKSQQTIQIYLSILERLPLVRFVGITGTTAMNGFTPHDDVDLFIITKSHMIWTSRFCVIILAKFLGIHGGTGICPNLFFDESDLVISQRKHNSYIAHELLQMKPVVDKNETYSHLMRANKWIFNYFPNALTKKNQAPNSNSRKAITDWFPSSEEMTQKIDLFFKSIQLPIIKKNKTGFRITDRQLWLFKNDFEKKLKRKDLGR